MVLVTPERPIKVSKTNAYPSPSTPQNQSTFELVGAKSWQNVDRSAALLTPPPSSNTRRSNDRLQRQGSNPSLLRNPSGEDVEWRQQVAIAQSPSQLNTGDQESGQFSCGAPIGRSRTLGVTPVCGPADADEDDYLRPNAMSSSIFDMTVDADMLHTTSNDCEEFGSSESDSDEVCFGMVSFLSSRENFANRSLRRSRGSRCQNFDARFQPEHECSHWP